MNVMFNKIVYKYAVEKMTEVVLAIMERPAAARRY